MFIRNLTTGSKIHSYAGQPQTLTIKLGKGRVQQVIIASCGARINAPGRQAERSAKLLEPSEKGQAYMKACRTCFGRVPKESE